MEELALSFFSSSNCLLSNSVTVANLQHLIKGRNFSFHVSNFFYFCIYLAGHILLLCIPFNNHRPLNNIAGILVSTGYNFKRSNGLIFLVLETLTFMPNCSQSCRDGIACLCCIFSYDSPSLQNIMFHSYQKKSSWKLFARLWI